MENSVRKWLPNKNIIIIIMGRKQVDCMAERQLSVNDYNLKANSIIIIFILLMEAAIIC